MTNRLAKSTSPYLQQHADNPVDWWEWGEEAFAEARRRDVPIFLSIGYSACHWCHVMAHESFEDPVVAAYLNENYVSIKVDREERPDVDSVYMAVTVAMTGQGGWPMSVFLDHEGRPFYAGTYFPPEPRHGMPSFPQVLTALLDAWNTRREELMASGQRIVEAIAGRKIASAETAPSRDDLATAVSVLAEQFDPRTAGFGGAPKFPPSMVLEFLLRYHALTGDDESLRMAEATFEAMARGGICDQLGGGFARYSVDSAWVVPHFEKMLYDNALLIRGYAHWWRLTKSPLAERVVCESIDFLLREMRTPEGGFASALDADSEGVEGRFYAWNPEELRAVLNADDAAWACETFSVTDSGTFEHGSSVLQLLTEPADLDRYRRVRAALMQARDERVRPDRDDKVVAAWNGLAIAALADAGAIFGEPAWIEAAEVAADLQISVHLGADGGDRLCRTSRDGRPGSSEGVLDDYGSLAEGLLALYQATGEQEWLAFAGLLIDVAVQHFADGRGGFFDTADDADGLITRPSDPGDNAEPSGWFAISSACVTYAALTGVPEYRVIAERALGVATALADRAPRAAGWGLAAATALASGPVEIAVVGDPSDPRTGALLAVARASAAPGAVIAFGQDSDVPLLRDRPSIGGQPTAYVCRGFVCQQPTNDPSALAAQLAALQG